MLYSAESYFSKLYFHQEQLVELFVPCVLGDLIHQNRIFWDSSKQDFLWLFRLTLIPFRWSFFDIDYATLITKPSLSFFLSLSLSSNRFPDACLLCFLFEGQNHQWETCKTRGFKHCGNTELASVLVRGFREIGDTVVLIDDERRVIVHRSDLVELFGLLTRGVRGIGQVAKLLVLVRSAHFLRFFF